MNEQNKSKKIRKIRNVGRGNILASLLSFECNKDKNLNAKLAKKKEANLYRRNNKRRSRNDEVDESVMKCLKIIVKMERIFLFNFVSH